MNKIIPVLLLGLSPLVTTAQQNVDAAKKRMADSVRAGYLDAYALKYPRLRQVTISQEFIAPGTARSKLFGNDLFKGKLGVYRTTANINIPVASWGKNNITAGLGMVNQYFKLDKVENYTAQYTVRDTGFNKTALNASVNYTRSDSLFGVPVIFNAGVTAMVDADFAQHRFIYRGLVSFSLIRNASTSLSVGGVYIKDPSSPTPFVPFVSYAHKFKALDAELFLDLPYRLALRKELTKKYSLTAFSELAGNLSFFDISQAPLPGDAVYSTLDLKLGMLFEYRFSKKAVFGLSGGVLSTLSSKMTASGEKTSNYFIKNTNQAVPYVNIGISLLPFWKRL